MAGPGYAAFVHRQPLRRSMAPYMQPHNADLQRTYAREGGGHARDVLAGSYAAVPRLAGQR